jgi:hypothetical protein
VRERLARGRVRGEAACLLFLATTLSTLSAQGSVQRTLDFYSGGGSYCFRVVPAEVPLSSEDEWTVMVLTSASNAKTSFKIRAVDAGKSGISGSDLTTMGMTVNGVWRSDRDRAEFFEKFAEGIRAGTLRAKVVQIRPKELNRLKSDRERADVYLKFADRGSSVAFDKAPDLTAEEFGRYAEYYPD